MHMCEKCKKVSGVILLILGILFLLKDVGVWTFWGINWYTAIFLLMGLAHIGTCSCKECKVKK